MGLQVSHDCFHAPYSTFAEFRRKLAALIGLDINSFCGYNGNRPNCIMLSRRTVDHDIYHLINHSDCDGVLLPHESELIADGLSDILSNNPNLENEDAVLYKQIVKFKDGCLDASSKNETIEFY